MTTQDHIQTECFASTYRKKAKKDQGSVTLVAGHQKQYSTVKTKEVGNHMPQQKQTSNVCIIQEHRKLVSWNHWHLRKTASIDNWNWHPEKIGTGT